MSQGGKAPQGRKKPAVGDFAGDSMRYLAEIVNSAMLQRTIAPD
jgi:hypothetical protein